jgi:hypothetical protein
LDVRSDLGEKYGVLPGPASKLKDGIEMLTRESRTSHLLIEITGEICVRVVDL